MFTINLSLLSAMTELFAALVTLVLLLGCLTERQNTERTDKPFIILLGTQIVLLLLDAAAWVLRSMPQTQDLPLVTSLSLIVDILTVVLTVFYTGFLTGYISDRRRISPVFHHIVLLVCAAMLIVWIVFLTSGLYIRYDASGAAHEGSVFFLTRLVNYLLIAANMLYIFWYHSVLGWKETAVLMSYGILPLLASGLSQYWPTTPPLLASTLSLLLLYVIIHIHRTRRAAQQEVQLMHQKLQLAQQELELTDSRTKIMLSQLQPHFLYNVLNAIYHLCGLNPKLAQDMVEHFSDYLRNNMSCLEQTDLIPFSEEYQHIETYLALERIRFPKTLDVVYNIEETNFRLPPLTVQPLVENAVRHGVTKKRGGGAVTLSTRATDTAFVITVADTGRGFDPEHYADDGQVHIGISSVRERLRILCGGTLTIQSTPGCGTVATVTIPKEEKAK